MGPGTPTPAEDRAIAKKVLAAGDAKHAALHCSFALALEPTKPEQLALVDEIYAASADPLSLVPLEGTTYFGVVAMRAIFLKKVGRIVEALELLVQVVAVRPDLPFGEWLDSWLDDETIAKVEPQVLARLFDLGLQRLVSTELGVANGRGVAERIAAAARRARTKYPESSPVAFALSRALRMSRKLDEALAVAKEEHEARPSYLSSVFLAGVHRDRGELKEAHARFEDALAKQPDDVAVRLDMGDLSLDLGRPDDAIAQYEWVLGKEPENPWAKPSALYAKFAKTNDKALRDELELLAENDTKGRARALALAITPYLGFLPRRPESVLGAVDAIREQVRQKGIDEVKKQPIKLQISTLEAPSAIRAAAAQFMEMGLAVDVEIGGIPQPDPRQPTQKTVYEIFKYEGASTKPVLPPASEKSAIAIARLAATRFHGPTWAELARRTAKELTFEKVPELLSLMVIFPPLPRAVLPDGKPAPSPFKLADWWFRVQVASALTIAFVDDGWEESVRKRALESMIYGPPDWITTAGMVALTALANIDPVARPHAEALLYGLIRPAPSAIELACVAQPLSHCLLQLPGLDADTKKSFRELRAEMERGATPN
jgi:tetratricopeptide (TPR) repeat protein